MRQLAIFPLEQSDKAGDLTEGLKVLLRAYIKFRSPGAPELLQVFESIWNKHP